MFVISEGVISDDAHDCRCCVSITIGWTPSSVPSQLSSRMPQNLCFQAYRFGPHDLLEVWCFVHTSATIFCQVLHLAYNGISQLPPLQLWRLPALRALFLQGAWRERERVREEEVMESFRKEIKDRGMID